MSGVITFEPTWQCKKSAITYLCRNRHQLTIGFLGSSLTLSYGSDDAALLQHGKILEELGWPPIQQPDESHKFNGR